jgi:hypothetical protein
MYKQNEIEVLQWDLSQEGIVSEEDLFELLKISKTKSKILRMYLSLNSLQAEQVGFYIGESFTKTKVLNALDEEDD